MTLTLLAPAKINLCLHVLRKRADGYHDLAMLMQRLSLCDCITLDLTDNGEVAVRCDNLPLAPGEENIAARAARCLLRRAGSRHGVTITIDKQIPVAAGLGGGSSDAATVLLGLNQLLGLDLGREELMAEGVKLGADVPFFVFGETAWATGIGDRLQPLPPLPPVHYVLVNPGVAVSTAWVYQNLALTSSRALDKLPQFPGTMLELAGLLHNDLERVTIDRYPVIAQIKQRLLDRGALGALMSGSGPTVFGMFAARHDAEAAAADFAREPGWRSFAVDPV